MITGTLTENEKAIIKQMRMANSSYREVATVLNCKIDRVKKYCRHNDLKGSRAKSPQSEALNSFIANLNKNHGGRFGYVSGYVHSDSDVPEV